MQPYVIWMAQHTVSKSSVRISSRLYLILMTYNATLGDFDDKVRFE